MQKFVLSLVQPQIDQVYKTKQHKKLLIKIKL